MAFLRRHADFAVGILLFLSLATLSWRRWASFTGDLNREWTTPARLASGERLYKDVAFYYGPLAPEVEAVAMRAFGARVGTVIGFDLLTAAGMLALLIGASRMFLPMAARAAVACFAVGVLAFAPDNGSFVACYSQSALIGVAFAWLAFILAARGGAGASGAVSGFALLSKLEAGPALAGAFFALRRRHVQFLAIAGLVAIAGYALALRGLSRSELIHYGPLRHLEMPVEFRELYLRIAGVHPALVRGAVLRAAAGVSLALSWMMLVPAVASFPERRSPKRLVLGASIALFGLALRAVAPEEPLLTTLTRGIPLLLVAALVTIHFEIRSASLAEEELKGAKLARAAAIVGLGFVWRTFLWTVPSLPYAPLAAVSALPAIAYLAGVSAVRAVPLSRLRFARLLVLLPLLVSPFVALPRLVAFYASPRTRIEAPRGAWEPPGEEGEIFSKLVRHLSGAGVQDRSLVVLPEAGALGFLLGVRSPLRLEQILPGLVDDRVDEETAMRLDEIRPERVVWFDRPVPEFGSRTFGRDYARRIAALLARDYREEVRFGTEGGTLSAAVLVRK